MRYILCMKKYCIIIYSISIFKIFNMFLFSLVYYANNLISHSYIHTRALYEGVSLLLKSTPERIRTRANSSPYKISPSLSLISQRYVSSLSSVWNTPHASLSLPLNITWKLHKIIVKTLHSSYSPPFRNTWDAASPTYPSLAAYIHSLAVIGLVIIPGTSSKFTSNPPDLKYVSNMEGKYPSRTDHHHSCGVKGTTSNDAALCELMPPEWVRTDAA